MLAAGPAVIDLLVDGTVPMGGVAVGGAGTRQLAIAATALPAGSSVQVVAGSVDYTGAVDPGTTVVSTLAASVFAAQSGHRAGQRERLPVRPRPGASFSAGALLGSGNPVWLLRDSPHRSPSRPAPALTARFRTPRTERAARIDRVGRHARTEAAAGTHRAGPTR